jgi:hypothetical protein
MGGLRRPITSVRTKNTVRTASGSRQAPRPAAPLVCATRVAAMALPREYNVQSRGFNAVSAAFSLWLRACVVDCYTCTRCCAGARLVAWCRKRPCVHGQERWHFQYRQRTSTTMCMSTHCVCWMKTHTSTSRLGARRRHPRRRRSAKRSPQQSWKPRSIAASSKWKRMPVRPQYLSNPPQPQISSPSHGLIVGAATCLGAHASLVMCLSARRTRTSCTHAYEYAMLQTCARAVS